MQSTNAWGQSVEYGDEAEAFRGEIEKGVAKLAQCYSEQKLVLAAIDGDEKETVAIGPAYLANGIANMRKNYTEIFSGTERGNLPPGFKEKQVDFEGAFTQMSSLANQLAGFEQDITSHFHAFCPPFHFQSAVAFCGAILVVPW